MVVRFLEAQRVEGLTGRPSRDSPRSPRELLRYIGEVVRASSKVCIRDFHLKASSDVVIIVGT